MPEGKSLHCSYQTSFQPIPHHHCHSHSPELELEIDFNPMPAYNSESTNTVRRPLWQLVLPYCHCMSCPTATVCPALLPLYVLPYCHCMSCPTATACVHKVTLPCIVECTLHSRSLIRQHPNLTCDMGPLSFWLGYTKRSANVGQTGLKAISFS